MNDTTALATLRNEVSDLSTEDSRDRAIDLYMRAEVALGMAREIKSIVAEKLAEWIDQNGEITVGDIRYYVGKSKTQKPRDLREVADRVLTAVAGDLDAFVDVLAANAFKPGAAKKLLGDQFDEVFETTEKLDLRTGKPARELKVVNTKFLPREAA